MQPHGAQTLLDAWQRFIAVLEAERDALVANDGERVAALAAQKSELAQTLARLPGAAPEAIGALARTARELNQVNAALLQQRLTQTHQALALLRVNPEAGSGGVYGRDGRALQSGATARGFTSA